MTTKEDLKKVTNSIDHTNDRTVGDYLFSYPEYLSNTFKKAEDLIRHSSDSARHFVKEHLDHMIAKLEKAHKKAKNSQTIKVRLPLPSADWVKHHERDIQDLISGKKRLVFVHKHHAHHHPHRNGRHN